MFDSPFGRVDSASDIHPSTPAKRPPMLANRSIPNASVIPVLAYPDVAAAVAWLCDAFGFAERLRIGTHRVQLTFAGGALVVRDGGGDAASGDTSIMVRVEDANAHCARAAGHGAGIVQPPADHPYGERQYTAVDPWGRSWTFSQSIFDSDPADWGGERLHG
jgi:uncharacterized glyoxalase superfamily protein PhnB